MGREILRSFLLLETMPLDKEVSTPIFPSLKMWTQLSIPTIIMVLSIQTHRLHNGREIASHWNAAASIVDSLISGGGWMGGGGGGGGGGWLPFVLAN